MLERRRIPQLIGGLAAVLLLAGCGDDSPVTPGREPLTFEGRLASAGFESHALLLERGGTVRLEVVDLTPIFIDISDLGADVDLEEVLAVGIGIGEFDEEGECLLELRPTVTQGRIVTVLVSDEIDCLAVFDSGQLPPDSLISYIVVVTDAAGS